MAQRKWTKENDPGKWAIAAAGTNDEGETYEQNMVKEAYEELGQQHLSLTLGPKQFIDDGDHRFFVQWFLASVDKSKARIVTQEEEVEAITWVSKTQLIKDLEANPHHYVPFMREGLVTIGII